MELFGLVLQVLEGFKCKGTLVVVVVGLLDSNTTLVNCVTFYWIRLLQYEGWSQIGLTDAILTANH